MTTTYDVIVIGAGSGGLTAAVGFAKAGKRVLLVERDQLGGECTNAGCIPSKALLHHAKAYRHATTIAGHTTQSDTYRDEAFTYVRNKINEIRANETPTTFTDLGITVVWGEAVFTDRCALRVGNTHYRYKTAIIATGSSPRLMDIPGLDPTVTLTNQNIFALDHLPPRTLVIGAGPIGLELGQALAMLGSQVTIATIDQGFVPLEDPAIRPILQEQFVSLGITIERNAFIQAVENGEAIFHRHHPATASFRVPFDKILLAIGRVPNLPTGTDAAGIAVNEQQVLVDRQYRTSNRYVYAIGDVAQQLKFTHTADDTARQVVAHVLSRGLLRVNHRKAVPKVTYTRPEMAQVGLSWDAAKTAYGEERLLRLEVPLTHNDRAHTDDTTNGMLVVIARRLNGTVLGAHLIGPAAGEIITLFTLAIDRRISLWRLRALIYAYPTYSLVVKKAGDQFFARQLADLPTDLRRAFIRHAPKVVALIFWVALIYSFHSYRLANGLSYTAILLQLLDFFTTSMWGPLVYIMAYALRPLILFPATLLTALSGVLFGFWWGIIYTVVGENASANFAYWIGRFFGNDMKLEDTIIGNWVTALRERPFGTVLFMRLFYVPFDLTNYGSGILKINWSAYATATLIGIMPGVTTFVALGAALDLQAFSEHGLSFDIFDPRYLLLSAGIFVVSLALSKLLKRWRANG